MGVYEGFKDVLGLVEQYKDTPLYEKIIKLRDQVMEQSDKNLELYEENQELKRRLSIEEDFDFDAPFYFRGSDKHPFCQRCMDADGKSVRLTFREGYQTPRGGYSKPFWICKVCDKSWPGQ